MKQMVLKVGVLLVVSIIMMGVTVMEPGYAKSLRDLIKRPPELYLPSQVLAGQSSTFTIRGKAGYGVKLIVSSSSKGLVLPDGTPLRVGRPTAEVTGVIPETGVLTLTVNFPEDPDQLGNQQYVEAITWPKDNPQQVEMAQIIESSGLAAQHNAVAVGAKSDGGALMVVPGDPMLGDIMRSISQLNDVRGDDRKMDLIDDGKINRERLIDQNLAAPID